MKRKFDLIVSITVFAVIISSCTKDIMPIEVLLKQKISVGATLPQAISADKAYLDPSDGYKVKWETGDQISINASSLTLVEIYGDATRARFWGSASPISGNAYWAVYPTGIYSNSTNASTLTVTLPQQQTYDISHPMQGHTYMAGKTVSSSLVSSLDFEMKNLVTLLKIPVTSTATNKNLKYIVVTVSNNNLYGSFTTTDPQNVDISGGTSGHIIVNCIDGNTNYIALTSTEKYIYVALPPISSSGSPKLTIRFYNTDNKYTERTATISSRLERSIYNTLPVTDLAFASQVEGKFTVASNKKVVIASGNLQYHCKNATWRFAENQYDYIGSTNTGASSTYNGWIDIFCWGTSGYHNSSDSYNRHYMPYDHKCEGVNSTYNENGYGPSYRSTWSEDLTGTSAEYDWGWHNAIGTYSNHIWRTPTGTEWLYLVNTRSASTVNGTSDARYAKGRIGTTNGIILFPDEYIHPTDVAAPTSINTGTASYSTNTYTTTDWVKMERAGCAFLPANGYCYPSGSSWKYDGGNSDINYWSVTTSSVARDPGQAPKTYARAVGGHDNDFKPDDNIKKYIGLSVRLVKDIN